MKNLFLKFSFLFISMCAVAQQEINTEFATKMNLAFQQLEKNKVPYGLLKDQAFEFTELSAYNGIVTDTNYVTPITIKQIYNTLLSARIHSNASQFIQPSIYEQRWQANRSARTITLSGLLYNYSQFKTNAVTTGKLQVVNNQFKDKYIGTTWQNPYDTRLTFAIAPRVRIYKGYNFFIKMPSNLWLTNVTQTVQTIQIDANDGLGYRATTFGQNLSVTYTTPGLKRWFYKITLSNGQILYSHSKIIIEEGLVTTSHIDSSGGVSLLSSQAIAINPPPPTTANTLGRKNITATLAYNGSYGSAKVVIDYASVDRKIRRPLIVAEGFDQGIYTKPEQEFGETSYKDFTDIITNSQSGQLQNLLTNIDTKQYDIVWVDFNNGTDYIQKNAYVLEAVITWVNAEKLANSSTQSNIVLGASMGGLVARYALKDMEDRSIPTQTSLYISHDSPHQGANFPIGYQYMSRHALHQYVQSPLLLLGGEVILPLFTDGVTPLDYLLIQNTPAARQILINYVGTNYGIINTPHDNWQNELRLKGYPSMRKIAISNGNHCAVTQNGNAGSQLLAINGNYSTGWLTDIVLTALPGVNSVIFKSLSILTAEPGFLVGILPGGNKIKLDFKVNALPSSGTNQIYRGKITYTKKLLWLVNINVTITDKSFNSPSGTLPYDYYPGGAFETGVRSSTSSNSGNFWQQLLFKYKMSITTEPSFCFIPAASALDIGLGNVPLNNSDYLKKYNTTVPLIAPKISPFDNFSTSFQNSFILNNDDNFQSTNEHHIYLNRRNANWLAREIDNIPNNNDSFDCSYMCSNAQISGVNILCSSSTTSFSTPIIAPNYNWTITQNSNLVTFTGNGTQNISVTSLPNASGSITISLTVGDSGIGFENKCGIIVLLKKVWIGKPNFSVKQNIQHIGQEGYSLSILSAIPSNEQGINNFTWVDLITGGCGNLQNSTGQTNYLLCHLDEQNCNTLNYCSRDIKVSGSNICGTLDYLASVGYGQNPLARTTNLVKFFKIYPNPTNNIINIELNDSAIKPLNNSIIIAELYNLIGEVKRNINVSNNIAFIDVLDLPVGIYILKISIDGVVESHQVAKQ